MEQKNYIAPQIKIRPVEGESILAASGDPVTVKGGTSTETVTSGFADSKSHYSVWDDDESTYE